MDVRRAGPLDISAIIALLMEMHKNTEIPVSPISSEKLVAKISEAIHRGIVFVAIDEKNEILGSIGGIISTDWWSDERHLSDMWFYVSKASRKTRVAYESFKKVVFAIHIAGINMPQSDRNFCFFCHTNKIFD